MSRKAVVLLSGGLDSVTCLAVAKKENFEIHALCFDYGQRHHIEIECARRSAAAIGVEKFHLIRFDLRMWGASALTSDSLTVPEFEEHRSQVPITYVPARNMIFLSFGAALAEGIGARDIFIGVNSMDYSGYPDCRPAVPVPRRSRNRHCLCLRFSLPAPPLSGRVRPLLGLLRAVPDCPSAF